MEDTKDEQTKGIDIGIHSYIVDPTLDANKEDEDGMAPLHRAADNDDIKQMKKLLAIPGIDVNVQIRSGNEERWTPLHYAARHGHTKCIKLLLQHADVNVNAQTAYGVTPLVLAVINGNIECVRLLLEYKNIQVNIKDNYGDTALAAAEQSEYNTEQKQEIVSLLIQHGATK